MEKDEIKSLSRKMDRQNNNAMAAIIIVGAMVLFLGGAVYELWKKPRVYQANIDYLIKSVVEPIAKEELSEEEVRKSTKAALKKLDDTLKQTALENHIAIINSKAAIAGSEDITEEIERRLK